MPPNNSIPPAINNNPSSIRRRSSDGMFGCIKGSKNDAEANDSSDRRRRCNAAKCRHYCKLFIANLFSHVGLCSLVVGYAILGALIFEALEASHEKEQRKMFTEVRQKYRDQMWEVTLKLNVLYKENWTVLIEDKLKEFEGELVTAVRDRGYDGKDIDEKETQWSFPGALLYSVTVITTIGYGNIAPKTAPGKVITILYALIGVPLMLLCLTNIGDLLANVFKFAYTHVCCILCREENRSHRSGGPGSVYRPPSRTANADGTIKYAVHPITLQPPGSPTKKTPLANVDVISEGSETESLSSTPKMISTSGENETPLKRSTVTGSLRRPVPPPIKISTIHSTLPSIDGEDIPTNKSTNASSKHDSDKSNKEDPCSHSPPSAGTIQFERIPIIPYSASDKTRVPIYLVLLFVAGYICLGALIFSIWENWTFLNGAYFCFITLSTIGFGDLVPGMTLKSDAEKGQAQLIICCLYLILGLAIIAMAFNLVQEEVIAKCKRIAKNIGILEEDNDE